MPVQGADQIVPVSMFFTFSIRRSLLSEVSSDDFRMLLNLRGGPKTIFCPWLMAKMRSEYPHDHVHVVLDQQDRHIVISRMSLIQMVRSSFSSVSAPRRLVEQHDFGLQRQRAPTSTLSLAVGEASDKLVPDGLQLRKSMMCSTFSRWAISSRAARERCPT